MATQLRRPQKNHPTMTVDIEAVRITSRFNVNIDLNKAAGRGRESGDLVDLIGRTVSGRADNRRVELTVARALIPA
jgi:hypothetical protein